ncbi:N-acylneuraminate-9-phosphatase isoform X2 [Bacillus rossius redtenbacheri]
MTERFGVPPDDARRAVVTFLQGFRSCPDDCGESLDGWRRSLWAGALGHKYASIAAEVYLHWLDLRYRCLALRPAVAAMLSTLRHHYLLALITNGPSRAQWEKVRRLELGDFFDVVLVSGDLPWEKPQRDIFLEACRCLGVLPCHCLVVGDKLETDIQGGVNACLGGTVWVPSGAVPHNASSLADVTLACVTDLAVLLPRQPECPSISSSS